jgi:hypothetical protein
MPIGARRAVPAAKASGRYRSVKGPSPEYPVTTGKRRKRPLRFSGTRRMSTRLDQGSRYFPASSNTSCSLILDPLRYFFVNRQADADKGLAVLARVF